MRLHYGMPRGHVVARDPKHRRILIGGLGALGVGQSWKDEVEEDKTRDGYDEAPIVSEPQRWRDQ